MDATRRSDHTAAAAAAAAVGSHVNGNGTSSNTSASASSAEASRRKEALLTKLFQMYLGSLKERPLLTKSITTGVISFLGPVLSHFLRGGKGSLPWRQATAFAIFGMSVTGPATHTLYALLDKNVPPGPWATYKKLLIDRLLFTPPFLVLFFLSISLLEGKSLSKSMQVLRERYWNTLKNHWRVWTVTQYINLNYVPLMYRVLFANFVALGWNAYLALTG